MLFENLILSAFVIHTHKKKKSHELMISIFLQGKRSALFSYFKRIEFTLGSSSGSSVDQKEPTQDAKVYARWWISSITLTLLFDFYVDSHGTKKRIISVQEQFLFCDWCFVACLSKQKLVFHLELEFSLFFYLYQCSKLWPVRKFTTHIHTTLELGFNPPMLHNNLYTLPQLWLASRAAIWFFFFPKHRIIPKIWTSTIIKRSTA